MHVWSLGEQLRLGNRAGLLCWSADKSDRINRINRMRNWLTHPPSQGYGVTRFDVECSMF